MAANKDKRSIATKNACNPLVLGLFLKMNHLDLEQMPQR